MIFDRNDSRTPTWWNANLVQHQLIGVVETVSVLVKRQIVVFVKRSLLALVQRYSNFGLSGFYEEHISSLTACEVAFNNETELKLRRHF
jgi:hypothetical protein